MLIWIPVGSGEDKNAKIVPQLEVKKWALVDFDAGEMKSVKFYDTVDDLGGEWVDFVILANKFENYIDFMNAGMMVLVFERKKPLRILLKHSNLKNWMK